MPAPLPLRYHGMLPWCCSHTHTHTHTHTHCKGTTPKIRNKYFQKRNCTATVPICVCERFIYSHDRSAFSTAGKYVDRSWEYIIRSQTHECGNWDWGRAIPRKEIHKLDFRCSARHGSHNTTLLPTTGTLLTGNRRELCREAGRDPDNLNRLGSSLVERLTPYHEVMSSNPRAG